MRIEDALYLNDQNDDLVITVDQLKSAILNGGGGRPSARTTQTVSYSTYTASPTVYYTALTTSGSTLTSRRTSGVTLSPAGDYVYTQNVVGVTEFIAVWDEGDAAVYTLERIVVDT